MQASSDITSQLIPIIFPEYMTPLTTTVEAVEGLGEGQQTGQIVECLEQKKSIGDNRLM